MNTALRIERIAPLALVALALMVGGCSTTSQGEKMAEAYEAARPSYAPPPAPRNGAIFQAGYEMSLFEDIRARRVGDILTIVLSERTNATKEATTNTARDTSVEIANPTLLGTRPSFNLIRPFAASLPGASLETSISGANSFAGKGDASQSNSLTGNVTVTVAEVLPNGNLVVRGQKRLTINNGDEYVQIQGIVRPTDINPDNTILSTKVADAKISYVGEGTLADANRQGWLAQFFNSKWWPF
ncbi:MAG TPA: flagellar basal body L-ring protein FlgH [Anaerolineae bacterium]|nr:flagellar basal body L-ring protein FlgH [Anaerolineae bacterium]